MPSRVDLHTHTTASDGTVEPADLLHSAHELSIQYLGVSDHDSTAGFDAMQPLLPQVPGVQLVPAIEINAEGTMACHILGYYINPGDAAFQKQLAEYRQQRLARLRRMAEKLQALGYPVDYEMVLARAKGGSLGRPHLADALIEMKVVRSRQEAFDRFLARAGPAYVSADTPTAPEGIALIRAAGGIPVLAHPSYYMTEELLKGLVNVGLMGIEVYYPEHSASLRRKYLEYAATYHLLATGGSDFHGPKTGRAALGSVDVPLSVIAALQEAKLHL